MAADHVEFHVEEASMEAALRTLLPRILGKVTFAVYRYQGKPDLLKKLPNRLKSTASWLPARHRVVVVIDADDEDCEALRDKLDKIAEQAGLTVRSGRNHGWQIANRIAIEELEAWYFGDWRAVRAAYPRVPDISRQAAYRDPDSISGGTWETFERVLQAAGYFKGGLQKIAAARAVAAHMEPARNTSPSFGKLWQVLQDVIR
jgi:hypothetical protein